MAISEIDEKTAMDWISQNWIWIVVAIALVFLMRRGGLAGCGMGHSHGGGHADHDAGRPLQNSKEPVSGKDVDTRHAVTSYYSGRVYYFENAETRQRFEASPEKYVSRAPAPSGQPAHRHHGC